MQGVCTCRCYARPRPDPFMACLQSCFVTSVAAVHKARSVRSSWLPQRAAMHSCMTDQGMGLLDMSAFAPRTARRCWTLATSAEAAAPAPHASPWPPAPCAPRATAHSCSASTRKLSIQGHRNGATANSVLSLRFLLATLARPATCVNRLDRQYSPKIHCLLALAVHGRRTL